MRKRDRAARTSPTIARWVVRSLRTKRSSSKPLPSLCGKEPYLWGVPSSPK